MTSTEPRERLAYSVDEAAALTGLSRELLYDQMRAGKLSTSRSAGAASSRVSIWKPSSLVPPDPRVCGKPRRRFLHGGQALRRAGAAGISNQLLAV